MRSFLTLLLHSGAIGSLLFWRAFSGPRRRRLADFARKHGAAFGRVELIRIVDGRIERLRLHEEHIREKVMKVTDLKHLAALYEQHG